MIETGIRRDTDPGFNPDITLEIGNAERAEVGDGEDGGELGGDHEPRDVDSGS